MKSIDQINRVNIRRHRALALVSAVMCRIEPYICDHDGNDHKRAACDQLLELFLERGLEVLTDQDRALFGLPPRGPDGWTVEEIIALERLRIEAMTRVPVVAFPQPPGDE